MLAVCFDVATAFSITQGTCADPHRKCRVSGGNMALMWFYFLRKTFFGSVLSLVHEEAAHLWPEWFY